MNRRGPLPFVPAPMQASEAMIVRCRAEIDGPAKKLVRVIVNYVLGRLRGVKEMGEGFQLGFRTKVPPGSRLGRYAHIGRGFDAPSPVSVGDLCMISTDVKIVANDHGADDLNNPIRLAFRWAHHVTVFEADVWVGHGVIIRAGVRVGRGAVVATGSILTRDVAPYSIVGGSPARLIRMRFDEAEIQFHDELVYGITQ